MPRNGTTTHEPQRPWRRPGGGVRWRFIAALLDRVSAAGATGPLRQYTPSIRTQRKP